MKKQFLMMAAVALALGSCSRTETVEVAENKAIGFDAFVGKTTKGATEVDNATLSKFYVFGAYNSTPDWTPVFTNVEVTGGKVDGQSEWTPTQTAYWKESSTYHFGAYSNGNGSFDGASFNAATQALQFQNYTAGENDLIAAIADEKTTGADVTNETAVPLTFKHLLSEVKFTFKNTDSHDYTMEISNIQIASATTTASGSYTKTPEGISWTSNPTGIYEFDDLSDIAAKGTHETALFVIPQSNTTLQVTFTATFSDGNGEIASDTFTGELNYSGTEAEAGKWTAGYRYNYIAEINGSDVQEELANKIIKFTVTEVTPWEDATETTINPQAN